MRFDKGLHLGLLRHRRRASGSGPRGSVHPARLVEGVDRQGSAAAAGRRSIQSGKPLLIIAEDVGGRGPVHPGGQQDPWHLQVRRRQGPRASVDRRKAMLQGHRHPHGWARSSAKRVGLVTGGPPTSSLLGPGSQRSSSPRTRPRSSRALGIPTPSRAGVAQIRAPRSRTATPTTTARSCRSAWPSWQGGVVAVIKARCCHRGGAQGAQSNRIEGRGPQRQGGRRGGHRPPVAAWPCCSRLRRSRS